MVYKINAANVPGIVSIHFQISIARKIEATQIQFDTFMLFSTKQFHSNTDYVVLRNEGLERRLTKRIVYVNNSWLDSMRANEWFAYKQGQE